MIAAIRRKLVLTPAEKKAVYFVVAALLIGSATKNYRDAHPQSPPGAKSTPAASPSARKASSPIARNDDEAETP